MYKSDVNIKHANKSHLYWGIDKSTGNVVHIDDVVSRGLNCNCKCAACQGDFIARKGKKNIHHFAHLSNYECVYANEIAVYILVKDILANCREISVPGVTVRMGKRIVTVSSVQKAEVGPVNYHCDPGQYPPVLIAELSGIRTRIILPFGGYFKEEDYTILKREARERKWYCLSIKLPRITDNSVVSTEQIENAIYGEPTEKNWVRSAKRDRIEKRIRDSSRIPATVELNGNTVYACPIHEREQDGIHYALDVDCDNCSYNCAEYPKCSCLAVDGYLTLVDLNSSPEQRMKGLKDLQKRIDDKREMKEQGSKGHENTYDHYRIGEGSISAKTLSEDEKYRLGLEEIRDKMNKPMSYPIRDSFKVRWAKCIFCGEIKAEFEMPDIGGKKERPIWAYVEIAT